MNRKATRGTRSEQLDVAHRDDPDRGQARPAPEGGEHAHRERQRDPRHGDEQRELQAAPVVPAHAARGDHDLEGEEDRRGHDDPEPSGQAGKAAPHRAGRDHDADQTEQQHAGQRRPDEHQHRDHEQHQRPEATQTGPHRSAPVDGEAAGRPARRGSVAATAAITPGAEPQRGGQHVGGRPGAPELVGREPADHEQPQVAPHDLPVGGDEAGTAGPGRPPRPGTGRTRS